MNVLFVYRGYGSKLMNAVVDNQARAIAAHPDVRLFTCPIAGGGKNYLKYPGKIRKMVKKHKIDIIHAHYSLSGFVASLAFSGKAVVCSLMGSDVWDKTVSRPFIPFFRRFMWKMTIVKSVQMQEACRGSVMVPNGVDMENFRPFDKSLCFDRSGFDPKDKNILFVAKVADMPVKNIALAQTAVQLLTENYKINAKLQVLENISFPDLPYYYNAADLLLLTSRTEGSPNVVKEALACNCPVVSTDVGDVKELIGEIEGCYITSNEAEDVAEKIKLSLEYKGTINTREKITHLDNKIIAEKIVKLYKDVTQ